MPDRSLTRSRVGGLPPGPPNPPAFIDLMKSSHCCGASTPAILTVRSRQMATQCRPHAAGTSSYQAGQDGKRLEDLYRIRLHKSACYPKTWDRSCDRASGLGIVSAEVVVVGTRSEGREPLASPVPVELVPGERLRNSGHVETEWRTAFCTGIGERGFENPFLDSDRSIAIYF